MKRRIIRADARNWAIQEWQEGGGKIKRGRYAGKAKQAKWQTPGLFFPSLADVARRLFQENVGDLPEGETLTGETLLSAIQEAEKRTVEAIQEAANGLETSFLIGTLQERGYVVTDGKKGRTTYYEE